MLALVPIGVGDAWLAVISATELWPLAVTGWCTGFSYAVAAHLSWGNGASIDFARQAALTSGATALLVLPVAACAHALIARGSIAALLKDR